MSAATSISFFRNSLEKARASRASDAVHVAMGLLVLGLSSYALLSAAGRDLGPARFAPVSALYILVYTLGPGLFLPLEQELARAVSEARAKGSSASTILATTLRQGAVLVLVAIAVVAAAWASITTYLFDGNSLLTVSLIVSIPAYALGYAGRGILAGIGAFRRYGLQLGLEGFLRLVGFGVIAIAGVANAAGFGLLIGALPLVAFAITSPRGRDLPRGPQPTETVPLALPWLLIGSLSSMVLVNAAPLAAKVLAPSSQQAEAGRFVASLLIVRVPLFLFAAVQAVLLPSMARLASLEKTLALRSLVLRLCSGFIASGFLLAGVAALFGPLIIRLVFGSGFAVAGHLLAVLALSTGGFAAATVLSQGLLAQRRYSCAVLGWGAGLVGVAIGLGSSSDVDVRATAAFALGTLGAVLTHLAVLCFRISSPLEAEA